MRGDVAMSGNFGYELDLTKLTKVEKEQIKDQVHFYKDIRHIIQFGQFYRLLSPFEGNETAWSFVSMDQSETVVGYFKVLAEPNEPINFLTLNGLNPDEYYLHVNTGNIYGGDELMYVGLTLPRLKGDFTSLLWYFKKVEKEQ
jgi:alpha-galactosidase